MLTMKYVANLLRKKLASVMFQ